MKGLAKPRLLLHGALLAAVVLIALLVRQQRDLKRRYQEATALASVLNDGDAVPAFRATLAGGGNVTIGEPATGKSQLLFVLTTTCPFCRATLPIWAEIAKTVKDSSRGNVAVYAVALDSVASAPQYLRSHGLEVPVVSFPNTRMQRVYRARAVPQTVVIGDSGRVYFARIGRIETSRARDSVVEAALRPLKVRADIKRE